MKPNKTLFAIACAAVLACAFRVPAVAAGNQGACEISVSLKLDHTEYVAGEKIRAVLSVINASTEELHGNAPGAPDTLFIEAYSQTLGESLERISNEVLTVEFAIDPSHRQDFEIFADRHFSFLREQHYMIRPVLVHGRTRYEGSWRAFSVVPGMRLLESVQVFSNAPGLRRDFSLVYWGRNRLEHLFLKVQDTSPEGRFYHTTEDLGPIMRVSPPAVAVRPDGEVVVTRRIAQDSFARSVFWSLPDVFEHQSTETLVDPDVAGSAAMKATYKEGGAVKAKERPWWQFW